MLDCPRPTESWKPHRGRIVLTIGLSGLILGLLASIFICLPAGLICLPLCSPLGITAWVMGHHDLWEIYMGQMDPGGERLTRSGMIAGILTTVLGMLAIGLILAFLFSGGQWH